MTKLSDYNYDLPDELIAQFPPEVRGTSRLLVAVADEIFDHTFTDLIDYLNPGDLIIVNNTRVIPARIYGEKVTGGKVEIMIERIISATVCMAQIKASKALKEGQEVLINGEPAFVMTGRDDAFFELHTVGDKTLADIMETSGHMPLPPYITRQDKETDKERYQTVFSKEKGAVAAPTAGLHFTDELLQAIHDKGIHRAEVTLHVGAGTFQPIRTDEIDNHTMHKEWIHVSEETVQKINATKAAGNRVIAIGTTVVRALESAALEGEIKPFHGDTHIFIKPGFTFRVIDGLVTNFHLPKSTLLVLVSTFMGKSRIENIYQHAITEKYRFYSYGDAMLLLPKQ